MRALPWRIHDPTAGRMGALPARLIRGPRVLHVRRPALLDPPKPPDRERYDPRSDKHRDDHEPEQVDVDVLEPFQKTPERPSCEATRPPSSIEPITSATATDRPVIVML